MVPDKGISLAVFGKYSLVARGGQFRVAALLFPSIRSLAAIRSLATHTFRRGGATSAVAKGVHPDVLLAMGRWKSAESTRPYVQPTKDELRTIRGVNNIYHNNGIQTWLVRSNGETENVEVG